jgi:hypothetical protein
VLGKTVEGQALHRGVVPGRAAVGLARALGERWQTRAISLYQKKSFMPIKN